MYTEGETTPCIYVNATFHRTQPILSAALGLGVYSPSNRNEYQKHKNNNVYGE
jgi:hypothetical protein